MRCGIFLNQHSLEPESWQMGITQTSHASLYPGSLSGVTDLTLPVLHFSFCGLVCAAQFSAISSIPIWPSLLCSDTTLSFAMLPAIFILSRVCHSVLTVCCFLSFPLQKQVMLQQENVPPQFEDQLLVIKGITVVTRQLPRPRFSSPSLISKAFKHMFTCGLIIISLRLSTAMLFRRWFMDP